MTIGVFDSGIGGLWILKYLKEALPDNDYFFVGDQKNVPYGNKSKEEIKEFSENITKFLIEKKCDIIVVACNTASAVALKYLREKFPEIIFVGMEPAIKPATFMTHTKKVGILATAGTFGGELFNSSVDKYANGVEIFKNTCDGLVTEIENGDWNSVRAKKILEDALYPMLENGVDVVVLGCTHYPFAIGAIEKIVGDKMRIINPTPSIVSQVKRIIEKKKLAKENINTNMTEVYTTGDLEKMKNFAINFLGGDIKVEKMR